VEGLRRIVLVQTMPVPVITEHMESVRAGLHELGYTDTRTAIYETVCAKGDRKRAESLLSDIAARYRPDIVITFATLASQAAKRVFAGTDVPVLFCVVADPVGAGLVERLHAPSGENITGRAFSISKKTLLQFANTLARQTVSGRAIRYGIVLPDYPSSVSDANQLIQAAASVGGAEFIIHKFPYRPMPQGLDAMLADARQGIQKLDDQVDFWWEVSGPLGEVEEFPRLLITESDKPIAYGHKMQTVAMGGILGLVMDPKACGLDVAALAHDILRGVPAGTMPVLPSRHIQMSVNLDTALKLDIAVPSNLLELAGNNIHR